MNGAESDFSSKLDKSIIPQLEAILHELDGDVLTSERRLRKRALQLARMTCVKLEAPMDTILRLSWLEPAYDAALKVALDSRLLDVLARHEREFVPLDELAKETGADATLTHRMLRHLAAMGAVQEKAPDSYAATPLVEELCNPVVSGGLDYWFDIATPNFANLPGFLARNGYKNPQGSHNGNWEDAKQTKLNFFDWMKEHPREMAGFANHMAGYAGDRGSWLDVYPAERLIEGARPEGVFIVDVGGGLGQDIEKFRQRYPKVPGRLVVQDLPIVIEEARGKLDSRIEAMAHDFTAPQPLQGARVYFLHSVLHDWTDENAIEILSQLKPAMERGYSKLLINECVIPATGGDPLSTALDLIVMGLVGSGERGQSDWERLLSAAGFRITKIFTNPTVAYESVIELELE